MREILFRGKRTDNGEWVYGSLTLPCPFYKNELPTITYHIHPEGQEYPTIIRVEVIPETVGQYTGLNDKNGKKIFEGDVVEFESHGYIPDVKRGSVIFKNGCYGIEFTHKYICCKGFHRIGSTNKWQDMGASGTITYTYEIIGNIHDNPELVEVK